MGEAIAEQLQDQAAQIIRLRAELANARLERDDIASLNSSLIAELAFMRGQRLKAELAEARRALLASNDTVLANKKLQEDNAAKGARIAELEAYHTNCTDYINGLLGNMADDDKERVAILARAERAEAELKAMREALTELLVLAEWYDRKYTDIGTPSNPRIIKARAALAPSPAGTEE